MTPQKSSVSVIDFSPNVTNFPQEPPVDAVSSVPSNRKPVRDNDEELIDNYKQISHKELNPLINNSSDFVAQLKITLDDQIETNNDSFRLSRI